MANPVTVVRTGPETKNLVFWCPGCDDLHMISFERTDGSARTLWEWDGNIEAPTISPSILTRWYGFPRGIDPAPGEVQRPAEQACHAFLRGGRWEFLTDSTHALAGQTVDMVPIPDWLAREAD